MSRSATDAVWERSRAKGTDLLLLLAIADKADDDGRDAWPGTRWLAKRSRLSERNVRRVLHRLAVGDERVIENNRTRRIPPGASAPPRWFFHVRCVYDYAAFAVRKKPDKLSDFRESFPVGRPRDQSGTEIGQIASKNRTPASGKSDKPGRLRRVPLLIRRVIP